MVKRTFVVIGLNTFGRTIVDFLCGKGATIIVIDQNEDLLERYQDIAGITACAIDATDEEALKSVGGGDVDVAIVSMGTNVAVSILVTTILKTLGVKEIIARARSHEQVRALKRVGATRVVFPEEDIAERIAHSILSPGVKEHIDIATGFDIAEVEISEGVAGKTLEELRLNEKFGIVVLAVVKPNRHKVSEGEEEAMARERGKAIIARSDYVVEKKDILVAVGTEKNIEKFEEGLAEYK